MHSEQDWKDATRNFPVGSSVIASVILVEPFGLFLDIPGCGVRAVLLVTEFEDGNRSFELSDYPQVGTTVTAVVVDHVEHNEQLRLSTKASRLRLGPDEGS